MLTVTVSLLILSGIIAAASVLVWFGLGRKFIPGYRFRASGKEAIRWEKKFLSYVAALIWSAAITVALAGIVIYFAEWRVILISSVFAAAVVAFWIIIIAKGDMRAAARKAKEFSE